MLDKERSEEDSTGNPQHGTQAKINSIKMLMLVRQEWAVVTLELILDMVDIMCHRIKETSTRCININIPIMISITVTMAKASKIAVVAEVVDTQMQDAVAEATVRIFLKVIQIRTRLTTNRSISKYHHKSRGEVPQLMAHNKISQRNSNRIRALLEASRTLGQRRMPSGLRLKSSSTKSLTLAMQMKTLRSLQIYLSRRNK